MSVSPRTRLNILVESISTCACSALAKVSPVAQDADALSSWMTVACHVVLGRSTACGSQLRSFSARGGRTRSRVREDEASSARFQDPERMARFASWAEHSLNVGVIGRMTKPLDASTVWLSAGRRTVLGVLNQGYFLRIPRLQVTTQRLCLPLCREPRLLITEPPLQPAGRLFVWVGPPRHGLSRSPSAPFRR